MPGIKPEIISYHLNIHPRAHPMRQKKRHITPECLKCLEEEVDKLLEVGFIWEVNTLIG